jgi:hypothetical protein
MKADTTRRPLLPAWASALPMKCTRQRCQARLASQRRPPRSARSGARNTRATAALMPSCAAEITSFTPASPRRFSLRRNSTRKVAASAAPIAMPSTSRRPSVLTAPARVTATETIRPASRTFT